MLQCGQFRHIGVIDFRRTVKVTRQFSALFITKQDGLLSVSNQRISDNLENTYKVDELKQEPISS